MKPNRATRRGAKRYFGAVLPVLLLAGCGIVGPKYQKPPVRLPDTFRYQIAATDAGSFADLPWFTVFNDQALQALINEALANNYDLQVAVAKIEQARALVGVVQSQAKPQVGYEAFGGGQNEIAPFAGGSRSINYGNFGGLLNAAWEFDVWGRIQHATESAEANLLAQEDVRRAVILTLVSDIAADYFHLLELDGELQIAQESARVYKSTLDLFTLRFNAGRDSRLPVERAQAAYDSSTADIQDLTRQIAIQENAISTLVGGYPRSIPRGRPLIEQMVPQTPLGTTTALLQRRPDILQAEQNMIGANAEIGVAVANFFPKIGLSTFVGAEAVVASGWAGFPLWSLALSAAGPIYTGGRLESAYRERQAYWDETVAHYKQLVLVAFRETSDALAAQQTLGGRRTALESQVRALQQSAELALQRYEAGRASYFEVLEAQQLLFPAQDSLAQTIRDQLLAVVNLYKALGGGWNAPPPSLNPPPPAPPSGPSPLAVQLPSQAGGE